MKDGFEKYEPRLVLAEQLKYFPWAMYSGFELLFDGRRKIAARRYRELLNRYAEADKAFQEYKKKVEEHEKYIESL